MTPVDEPDPAEVEALAEVLSYATGEFTQYADDAHPDHNRWSWRGDGHGAPTDSNPLRDQLRDAARAVLTSDWLADHDRTRDRELGERIAAAIETQRDRFTSATATGKARRGGYEDAAAIARAESERARQHTGTRGE